MPNTFTISVIILPVLGLVALLVMDSPTFSAARNANALIALGMENAGVFRRKLMSIVTMSLASVSAALSVNSTGDVFQVGRIDAPPNTTEMINRFIFNKALDKHLECYSVSTSESSIKAEVGIAASESHACPQPARTPIECGRRVYFNLSEEAGEQFEIYKDAIRIVLNHLSLRYRFDGLGFRGLTHREALSF